MPIFARGVHLGALVILLSIFIVVILSLLSALGMLPAPIDNAVSLLTQCPFKTATGLPCPLCGTTTAARLLLQGAWQESRTVNPLAIFLAPIFITQLCYRSYRIHRPRLILKEELFYLIGASIVGALLLFVPQT